MTEISCAKKKKHKLSKREKLKQNKHVDTIRLKKEVIDSVQSGVSYNQTLKNLGLSKCKVDGWRDRDQMFASAIGNYLSSKNPHAASSSSRVVSVQTLEKDPSKVDLPDMIEEVSKAIENGCGFEMACLYASVSPGLVRHVMQNDK